MNPTDIISSGLLELYVTGTATQEETLQVEAWMTQYPEVRAEVNAIRESLELFVLSTPKAPSPSVKEKLFAAIKEESKDEFISPTVIPVVTTTVTAGSAPVVNMVQKKHFSWLAAAGVVILLGSILTNILFYNRFKNLRKDNDAAYQLLSQIKDSSQAMADYLNVIQSKYSELVALSGQAVAPEAAAKVFWIKKTGEVYIDPANLPPAPKGKQYQFWGIVNGQPVDGGMISLDPAKRYQILKMKSFGSADAFAITLEKEGGSPTPDLTQLYVMGKI